WSPDDTARFHGITYDQALREGTPEELIVQGFLGFAEQATIRVGHSETFDARVMRTAIARFRPGDLEWWDGPNPTPYCTMESTKRILGPEAPALAKGRTVKLSRVYDYLFPFQWF